MEDHRFIPELASPSQKPTAPAASHATPRAVPAPVQAPSKRQPWRLFRKGDSVAEIRERSIREFQMIEWSLLLNGRVVTTRQFGAADRDDFDYEVHRVTTDLAGSGWHEVKTSTA